MSFQPISTAVLAMIMPAAGTRCLRFIDPINEGMREFGIDTMNRKRYFLAHVAHESNQLKTLVESLNYRPEAILATFNTAKVQRFTRAQAEQFGRTDAHPANQEAIANIAYANRMGNGDVESGDGFRHRGRGLIQTTGRDNYLACMLALDIDCVAHPELLEQPLEAARAAGLFWHQNGLNALADKGDFHRVTKIINGGYKGLAERMAFLDAASRVIFS
jgi:putative chitinase